VVIVRLRLVQVFNADAKDFGQINLSLRGAHSARARGAFRMPLAALACLVDAFKASVLRQEFAELRSGGFPCARCVMYVFIVCRQLTTNSSTVGQSYKPRLSDSQPQKIKKVWGAEIIFSGYA
jgi:hypothetical protein